MSPPVAGVDHYQIMQVMKSVDDEWMFLQDASMFPSDATMVSSWTSSVTHAVHDDLMPATSVLARATLAGIDVVTSDWWGRTLFGRA